MARRKNAPAACPSCQNDKGLVVYYYGLATLRVPLEDGHSIISDEMLFLRDPPLSGDKTIVRFSDVELKTRILIMSDDEQKVELYCPKCEKISTLDSFPLEMPVVLH